MRAFHLLAYEGFLAEGQIVYSPPTLSELFGTVDHLHVGGYTSQVSGTDPGLIIATQDSADGENWALSSILFAVSLGAGETLFQSGDADLDLPPFLKGPFRRLVIALSGTGGANAMVRVWVTGRDSSRRAGLLLNVG